MLGCIYFFNINPPHMPPYTTPHQPTSYIIPRYIYPTSSGYTRKKDQEKVDRLEHRMKHLGFLSNRVLDTTQIVRKADFKLFQATCICNNLASLHPKRKNARYYWQLEQGRIIPCSLLEANQTISHAWCILTYINL